MPSKYPKFSASRRELMETCVVGLAGSALAGCSGVLDSASRGPRGGVDSGDDPHGGTGGSSGGLDTGSDTGADAGLERADTGPELPDRVPGSLTRYEGGELDLDLIVLSGTVPEEWGGHLWLVHGSPSDEGGPVFLGDGQLVRMDLSAGSVRLLRRTLETPCAVADQALAGTEHAFENSGMARMSMSVGVRNFANTAVVPLGDRVLVTFDAGRPFEVDPETLEVVTAVGWNREWRSALPEWVGWFVHWPFPLLMSTAHPAVDPESGELFSVAYGLELLGMGAFTELVRWDGSGELETWELLDTDGLPVEISQSVHQLALTRNHVILADTAFLVEVDLLMEGETQAQSPDTVLWIIDRADLSAWNPVVTARTLTVPREAVHMLADFDDDDGIVLHMAHNPGADPSEFLEEGDLRADTGGAVRSDLLGLPAAPTDLGALARYVIDPKRAEVVESIVRYDDRLWGGPALAALLGPQQPERLEAHWWCSTGFHSELRLARIEGLYADHPYREVPLSELPSGSVPATLVRVDAATAEVVDHYAFPVGRVGLSPTFVPHPDGDRSTQGWVVVVVFSDDTSTVGSSGDELWVFDAELLDQGPLVRFGHPRLDLPFTLHTAWTPSADSRTAAYAVDVREDLEGEVAWLDESLQQVFEDQVYPRFS